MSEKYVRPAVVVSMISATGQLLFGSVMGESGGGYQEGAKGPRRGELPEEM